MQKIFRYHKIFELRRVSRQFFSSLREKMSPTDIRDISALPLSHSNTFRYQSFSETQNGSLTTFFGTERKEISDGKSRYSILLPLSSIKHFDSRNFLQLRRVLRRNCSLPREKKSSTEIRDTPSFPLSHP